jgi:hypothetical protein
MATLNTTLTLSSSDISADETLSISLTDALSVLGPSVSFQVVTSSTGTVFAAAANYTTSYVLIYNTSTTGGERIVIEKADGGDEYMKLEPSEFAFFPWAAEVDLAADSLSGTPTLEVRIFQAAE